MTPTATQKLIYKMLTESTGAALGDSGGAYGRHWETNQKRTIKDFLSDKTVTFDDQTYNHETKVHERVKLSTELSYTISVFHFLDSNLELDSVCNAFNRLKCLEWDSDTYGISQKQEDWLINRGFTIGKSFNTYNYESSLSQVIQGTNINSAGNESNFEYPEYMLIQIHNGCDVRGGYTDAKLFKVKTEYAFLEDVYGTIGDKQVSNSYDGYSLTDDNAGNGEAVTIEEHDTIELYLSDE